MIYKNAVASFKLVTAFLILSINLMGIVLKLRLNLIEIKNRK